MKKVALFSLLLVAGLVVSQFIPAAALHLREAIVLATMVALSFIMIHVGYEFEIDKSQPQKYAWDCVVAFTAAGLPWLLCSVYFVLALMPRAIWGHGDAWKESLLMGLFAAPTSAGVLFSMLAAAGLSATWVFKKARILAIFDDLGTILLIIPLKILLVGIKWQLIVIVVIIFVLLWAAWKYLNVARWPNTWRWVLLYSVLITLASHFIYVFSTFIDDRVPIHLEVLLPAFVLGCVIYPPTNPHVDDAREGHQEGPESRKEQRVSTIISAIFMVLVGLSMPAILSSEAPASGSTLHFAGVAESVLKLKHEFPGWGMIALHVLAITILSNLGKMFAAFCYRKEASLRQRLAIAVGMFPRGEVGAGVLVISLSYGMGGPALTVAVLSLALNLMGTGLFIVAVKKLLAPKAHGSPSVSF